MVFSAVVRLASKSKTGQQMNMINISEQDLIERQIREQHGRQNGNGNGTEDGYNQHSRSYASFFALMPADNAGAVVAGAAVAFPQDGPKRGSISRADASTFNLPEVGTYEISWQASMNEPGQLQLAIGGVGLPNSVVGRQTSNSQVCGSTLITTTAANSVLSVINPAGSAGSLTLTPNAGGVGVASATLTIKQL